MVTTTKYIYDGFQYLGEADGDDVVSKRYVNEPDQYSHLIGQIDVTSDHSLHYHYDSVGSTRDATDNSETVTDKFTYDTWGNQFSRNGTSDIPFQYVGEHGYYRDGHAESYYVMARNYSPQSVRWLSIDPHRYAQHMSLYAYSSNSPAMAIDPSGLRCIVCGHWLSYSGERPSSLDEFVQGTPYTELEKTVRRAKNDPTMWKVGVNVPKLERTGTYLFRNPGAISGTPYGPGDLQMYFTFFYVSIVYCEDRLGECKFSFNESTSFRFYDGKKVPAVKDQNVEVPISRGTGTSRWTELTEDVRERLARSEGWSAPCNKVLVFVDAPGSVYLLRDTRDGAKKASFPEKLHIYQEFTVQDRKGWGKRLPNGSLIIDEDKVVYLFKNSILFRADSATETHSSVGTIRIVPSSGEPRQPGMRNPPY